MARERSFQTSGRMATTGGGHGVPGLRDPQAGHHLGRQRPEEPWPRAAGALAGCSGGTALRRRRRPVQGCAWWRTTWRRWWLCRPERRRRGAGTRRAQSSHGQPWRCVLWSSPCKGREAKGARESEQRAQESEHRVFRVLSVQFGESRRAGARGSSSSNGGCVVTMQGGTRPGAGQLMVPKWAPWTSVLGHFRCEFGQESFGKVEAHMMLSNII